MHWHSTRDVSIAQLAGHLHWLCISLIKSYLPPGLPNGLWIFCKSSLGWDSQHSSNLISPTGQGFSTLISALWVEMHWPAFLVVSLLIMTGLPFPFYTYPTWSSRLVRVFLPWFQPDGLRCTNLLSWWVSCSYDRFSPFFPFLPLLENSPARCTWFITGSRHR